MPLTRDFRDTVKRRVENDSDFRAALLTEAIDVLLSGDLDTAKPLIRDYVNATVGFDRMGIEIGIPSKSLMRMFSAKGNPRAENLIAVIRYLQEHSGVHLSVQGRAA